MDDFKFRFVSSRPASDVFAFLKNPENWWVGLFGEAIAGKSENMGDEFSFRAGEGMHETHQQLVELLPEKAIAWRVTQSHLSFLTDPNEWTGTIIRFDLAPENGQTAVTFTHEGLVPQIECYGNCAPAWTQYMENLRKALQ